jgi:Protein of unknown function (DUF3305)
MSTLPPCVVIPVGVVVDRIKATSPWADYLWRPSAVLAGEPETAPWTKLAEDDARAVFYAGSTEITLHRSDTGDYRDNLATGTPALWVVLRESSAPPPYRLYLVTASPAEGESMTEAGNDIVEAVPMPEAIRDQVAAFVAAHHVEHGFVRRTRDRANLESLGRHPPEAPKDSE